MTPKYIIPSFFFLLPTLLFAQTTEQKLYEAFSLSEQGQTQKAKEKINILKKEHLNDSTYSLVLMLSMEIEEKSGNYEQALKDNEECLKLPLNNETSIQQNIGRLKKNIGDFSGSERAFKRVIELDPFDKIVYTNLAILYNNTYRYSDAINILRANPNQSKSAFEINSEYQQYATAFLNLKKYDTAKIFIDNYLLSVAGEKDEIAFYQASLIYSYLKDKKAACKFIHTANQLIFENKVDQTLKTSPLNIQKRWFYKRYSKDIQTIKKAPKYCVLSKTAGNMGFSKIGA